MNFCPECGDDDMISLGKDKWECENCGEVVTIKKAKKT